MERFTIKTVLGSYDYEVITKGNVDIVATISKTDGNRYLRVDEVPKAILAFLKNCNYKVKLYDADKLNAILGLRK